MRQVLLVCTAILMVLPVVFAHYATTDTSTQISFRPVEPPFAGEPVLIDFTILNGSGQPRLSLDTVHERILHVFIMAGDLTTFSHIHPEDFKDGLAFQWIGAYSVETKFPYEGPYLIVADYSAQGQAFRAVYSLTVNGSAEPGATQVPTMPQQPGDFSRTKQFEQYTVVLEGPNTIYAGTETELVYRISTQGKPVQTLGQYLGSEMHVAGMRSDLSLPFHTHAYIPGHSMHAGNMPQRYIGPTVPARITFPEPGTYTVFSQFNESGTIVTTQFLVLVSEAATEDKARSGAWEVSIAIAIFVITIAAFISMRKRQSN